MNAVRSQMVCVASRQHGIDIDVASVKTLADSLDRPVEGRDLFLNSWDLLFYAVGRAGHTETEDASTDFGLGDLNQPCHRRLEREHGHRSSPSKRPHDW